MDEQDQEEEEEEDDFKQGPSRDSLESGYSSGAGVKTAPSLENEAALLYYNDIEISKGVTERT